MSLWLSECCTTGINRYSTTAELFDSWKRWAERTGEFVGSQKRFSQSLEARGLTPKRQNRTGKAGFDGLSVNPSDPSNAYWNR